MMTSTLFDSKWVSPDWRCFIETQCQADYLQRTLSYVAAEREQGKIVFPASDLVFNAFQLTPLAQTKVVILGQDPYHGAHQAHGLSFSVPMGVPIPPSLKNIYKELAQDISGFSLPHHGNLTAWAKQGVLLLNTVLTVEQGQAHSHAHLGWELFTDHVMQHLNQQTSGVVFLLWGAHAQKKGRWIDSSRHKILCAPHPSPLAAHRGFFGCRHFSQTNDYLIQQGKLAIVWELD